MTVPISYILVPIILYVISLIICLYLSINLLTSTYNVETGYRKKYMLLYWILLFILAIIPVLNYSIIFIWLNINHSYKYDIHSFLKNTI